MKYSREGISGKKGFIALFFLGLLALSGPTRAEPFQREKEFPNYFAELPPDVAKAKIDRALDSLLRRILVPYVDDAGQLQKEGFFLKLNEKISQASPNSQAYISGGVVRNLLDYIYTKIHSARQKDPHANVGMVLDRIAQRDKDVPMLKILGIGSDVDILIDSPPNHSSVEAKDKATSLINSALARVQGDGNPSRLHSLLAPFGDVNDYHQQIQRSVSQGGSSLDWLAYPLPRKDGKVGSIREPEGSYRIMDHFVKGEEDYLPPLQLREDSEATTIRGLRPDLQLPFLKRTPSGEILLQEELDRILEKVRKGGILSDGALKQFKKMIANARFGGAYNRIHRSQDQISKAVLEISRLSSQNEKGVPLVPEFLERHDLKSRRPKELPSGLSLMPVSEFIKNHTEDGEGKLYHGTPHIETLLGMVRNGMVRSSARQGNAAFGSGAYLTKDYELASGYSGTDGVVIPIPIKTDPPPRILKIDDPEVWNSPALAKIRADAQLKGRDLNEELAQEYGIDIIINTHILVQNATVIKTPKNLQDVIEVAATQAKRALSSPSEGESLGTKLQKVRNFSSYSDLAEALHIPEPVSPNSLAEGLLSRLHKEKGHEKINTLRLLGELRSTESRVHEVISEEMDDGNEGVQLAALEALGKSKPRDTHFHEKMARFLKHPDEDFRLAALSGLREVDLKDPDVLHQIAAVLEDPSMRVRFMALEVLAALRPTDAKTQRALFEVLLRSNKFPLSFALNVLNFSKLPVSDADTCLLILETGHPELLAPTEADTKAFEHLVRNLVLKARHATPEEKQEIEGALRALHIDDSRMAKLKEKASQESQECSRRGLISPFSQGLDSIDSFIRKLNPVLH